jgi:hypothetical protein
VDSIFDRQFLNGNAFLLLDEQMQGTAPLDPAPLVKAWSDQFSSIRESVQEPNERALEPVVAQFLQSLHLELHAPGWNSAGARSATWQLLASPNGTFPRNGKQSTTANAVHRLPAIQS